MSINDLLDMRLEFYHEGSPIKASIALRTWMGSRSKSVLFVRSVEVQSMLQGYVIVHGLHRDIRLLTKPYLKNLEGHYALRHV